MSSLKGCCSERHPPCHPQSPLVSCFLSGNQKVPDFDYKLLFPGAVYKLYSPEKHRKASKYDEHFFWIIVPPVLWGIVSLGNSLAQKPTPCPRVRTCPESTSVGLDLSSAKPAISHLFFFLLFGPY